MAAFRGMRTRLNEKSDRVSARFWKSLEKPLRFDAASNERRLARMGKRRLELVQWAGLILTVVNFIATPAWEIALGPPWKPRWAVVAMGSGVVLFALLIYMYWQGRPYDASTEARLEAEALEAKAGKQRRPRL